MAWSDQSHEPEDEAARIKNEARSKVTTTDGEFLLDGKSVKHTEAHDGKGNVEVKPKRVKRGNL